MRDRESDKLIVDFMGVKPVKGSDGYFTYSDGVFFASSNDTYEKTMEDIIGYVKSRQQSRIAIVENGYCQKLAFLLHRSPATG
jgi:hypothetical protein